MFSVCRFVLPLEPSSYQSDSLRGSVPIISEATLRPSPTRAVHAGDEVLDRVPLGRQRREGHVRPPERRRRGGGGAGVDVKAVSRVRPALYTFDVESLRKYTPAVRGAGRVAGWWVPGNILPRYTTGLTPTAGAATCRPAGIRSKTQREICACAELQPCAPAGRRSVAARGEQQKWLHLRSSHGGV
jgi:hypothetical protein